MSEVSIAKYLDSRRLHLIILPTGKCNFRCKYCYEDFKLGKMNSEVVRGIKSLLFKRASELNVLEIGWFGGEPLLNRQTVMDISQYAKNLMLPAGKSFISSMSTNGYLLNLDIARSLVLCGINSYQISIDGDKLNHDKTRVQASGGGSFDRIWNNLIAIHKSDLDIKIVLRLQVSKDNIKSMWNIAERLNSVFSGDTRFRLHIKPIVDLGGDSVHSINLLERDKFLSEIIQVESYFSGDLLSKKQDFNPNDDVCYAAAGNSLVILPSGELSKCTVLLGDRDNQIGRIEPNGELVINNKLFGKWVTGLFNNDSASCPVKHVKNLTV